MSGTHVWLYYFLMFQSSSPSPLSPATWNRLIFNVSIKIFYYQKSLALLFNTSNVLPKTITRMSVHKN